MIAGDNPTRGRFVGSGRVVRERFVAECRRRWSEDGVPGKSTAPLNSASRRRSGWVECAGGIRGELLLRGWRGESNNFKKDEKKRLWLCVAATLGHLRMRRQWCEPVRKRLVAQKNWRLGTGTFFVEFLRGRRIKRKIGELL